MSRPLFSTARLPGTMLVLRMDSEKTEYSLCPHLVCAYCTELFAIPRLLDAFAAIILSSGYEFLLFLPRDFYLVIL